MKHLQARVILVVFSAVFLGSFAAAWAPTPVQKPPATDRSLMEEMYTRLLDVKTDIMAVRHDHVQLLARFTSYAHVMKQQGEQIDALQKSIEGLTIGPLAGPLTHDLDKRVVKIEAYIESDKNLKTEMAWWFRTLGAAALLWLAGQLWAHLRRVRVRIHDRRLEEHQSNLIKAITIHNISTTEEHPS